MDPIGFVMLNDVTASLDDGGSSSKKRLNKAEELGPGHLGLLNKEVPASSLSSSSSPSPSPSASDDAVQVKEWATTRDVLSTFLLRDDERAVEGYSGSRSGDSGEEGGSGGGGRCMGKHVTFAALTFGFSLRSRGRRTLPVVDKITNPQLLSFLSSSSGLRLEEGDVLVSIDGQRLNEYENPLAHALKVVRDPYLGGRPLTLSFAAASTETLVLERHKAATAAASAAAAAVGGDPNAAAAAAGKGGVVGFVFSDSPGRGGRSSESGGSFATIRIVPAHQQRIKSARYKKGELVPGRHKVINLRCASLEFARAWVEDLNSCVAHSICAV